MLDQLRHGGITAALLLVLQLLFSATTVPAFSPRHSSCTRIFPRSHWLQHSTTVASATTMTTSTTTTTNMEESNSKLPPERHDPLPPHTFAGMVEAGIIERFGATQVERVLQSWRMTERGYYHKQYIGPTTTAISNTDGATTATSSSSSSSSMCFQESHSYVPGLTIRPFWNVTQQPWASKIKSKYSQIRQEFKRVTADLTSLSERGNNIWAGALTQDASTYGESWRTLVLMDRGVWDDVNVNLFPITAKAIHDAGVPAVEVFFARMQPQSSIKPHSDFTNFVLTSHLALEIPYSGQNKCRLTIADQTQEWINGELYLFDTSLLHDAVNDSDQIRYILMMRIWHPDLTTAERGALQFIFDCLNAPEIVTVPTMEERLEIERQMKLAREFPVIQSSVNQGFGGGSKGSKAKKDAKKKRK